MKVEAMGTTEGTTETTTETVALRRLWVAGRFLQQQKLLSEEQATLLKETAISLNKTQALKKGLSRRERAAITTIGILLDVIVSLLKKAKK